MILISRAIWPRALPLSKVPPPLPYEPSLKAIIAAVLPAGAQVLAGDAALRRRVSWPLLARATGLGQIEGDELILVPQDRLDAVLPFAGDLSSAGVAALVVAGERRQIETAAGDGQDVPIIVVSPGTDMRKLGSEIERFMARRRRELFALDRELHHTLVDAALAGTSAEALLAVAQRRAGRPVAVDRDGEIITAMHSEVRVPQDVLVRARIATRQEPGGAVEVPGPPPSLALPITTGKERRGIALLLRSDEGDPDEDEALLAAVASACAIVLTREPPLNLSPLSEVLASNTGALAGAEAGAGWTALAVEDSTSTFRQVATAVRAELEARSLSSLMARDGDIVIVLTQAGPAFPWEAAFRSIRLRLASPATRAGLGRFHDGADGISLTADEAIQAVRWSTPTSLTPYDQVELAVLLSSNRRWAAFAEARLGPLLAGGEDSKELLKTLEGYLACGRNAKAAAQSLQVHRNTLLYRLRRIEERLGVDLDDPETLFALDLATRALTAHTARLSQTGGSG